MASKENAERIEWIAGSVSALVVLGMIGFFVYEGLGVERDRLQLVALARESALAGEDLEPLPFDDAEMSRHADRLALARDLARPTL